MVSKHTILLSGLSFWVFPPMADQVGRPGGAGFDNTAHAECVTSEGGIFDFRPKRMAWQTQCHHSLVHPPHFQNLSQRSPRNSRNIGLFVVVQFPVVFHAAQAALQIGERVKVVPAVARGRGDAEVPHFVFQFLVARPVQFGNLEQQHSVQEMKIFVACAGGEALRLKNGRVGKLVAQLVLVRRLRGGEPFVPESQRRRGESGFYQFIKQTEGRRFILSV